MIAKEVACVRCWKVVVGWIVYPDGNYCADCHYFKSVLLQVKSLTREQQRQIIAELEKGD